MTNVRKALALVLLACTAAPMVGCGVGTTPQENARKIRRIAEYDARMLVDDVSLLIETDRPIRTSRWVID